jgi:branched-subunit amino acid ABC-type transport system permease component
LRPREILLLAVTTFAALRSVRHIPIYALIAVPILSATVLAWLQQYNVTRRLEEKPPAITLAKASLNTLLLAAFLIFMILRVRYIVGHQMENEAKEFPPDYPVYIDGRADLYGDGFMDDLAATYYLKGDAWKGPFEKWAIQTVVLPPDAPLVTALQEVADWKTVYSDKQAVVLTKLR